MAGLIRSVKRTQLLCKAIIFSSTKQNPSRFVPSLNNPISEITRRNYIAEMRKSAFEGNILRLLRNEIQYELERSPPKQPVTKFNSFTVDDRPGEQWIRLTRKFGESEDIRVEATMFDGSIPISKAGVDENVKLHITLIVNISKGDGEAFEIMCSAWPDGIEITKLFIRQNDKMPANPYFGPEFKELDDELQDSLYEFLEERGINEELAVFLHGYMKNKDKTEFIKWMQTVKSYIEQK
ncbi:putative Mitochondrial glycoprotein family protein [Melia azedarach]|uniref:Mitochondrial glycoprotein family protein n=1 Tax=Melia azedarach TaxID=155640 RepID=A0ACC1Y6H3_MELAZ|nr:putative Mitochondrial glycoprotein family protein [Melia azedarach]